MRVRGVHPRLIPHAPCQRPPLAVLHGLEGLGEDLCWALWYSLWQMRTDDAERDGAPVRYAPVTDGVADRFRAARQSAPELDAALDALLASLADPAGGRLAADAFYQMAEWATGRGFGELAIQCAEASAALRPRSSWRALAAGRTNRVFGETGRAELFYERALTLARLRRRWRDYVRAHLGLGQVKYSQGDSKAARAHYFTAARAARSLSGEKWLAAQTQHDLLLLAAAEGAVDEAQRYARRALEWYPRHHDRLPALVHDCGFLLVRMGLHAAALPLLQAVMRAPISPHDQVIGWSTLARASAGVGDAAGFRGATERTLRLVGLFDLHATTAFANLACGARLLGLPGEAEQYARRSLEISAQRGEAEAVDIARAVLDDLRAPRGETAAVSAGEHRENQVLQLAAELTARLSAWRGPTWKRKRQSGRERLGRV